MEAEAGEAILTAEYGTSLLPLQGRKVLVPAAVPKRKM